MSKRGIAKYGVASLVTAGYGLAVYRKYNDPQFKAEASKQEVVIAATILSGLTWIAAIL